MIEKTSKIAGVSAADFSNPVDSVAGLVYLLYSQNVPTIIYDADQSEEHVWTELVSAMQDWFRAGLLFLYQNLEREQILASIMDAGNDGDISQVVGQQRSLSCKGYRTDGDGDGYYDILRRGKLDVKVDSTIEHAFDIATDHGFSIPDGVYALRSIVLPRKWLSRLLEKQKGPGETFMKVSVFRMASEQE
ncbi:hypothetical protein EDD18DRAFT_1365147 [Armillaria luteobubalina]|uniref:Uncharacterized protein n=1 Tax=Armillaria luteobubalina TaxID=153913 RepID=A0AA39U9D8_9AGAR|nr:hypothetical protein EDD18DRAFT_1365147 [Armillaria luteobubalina]